MELHEVLYFLRQLTETRPYILLWDLGSELGLNVVHLLLGDFEGLCQHLIVDVGREQSWSDLLDPWVLAAQRCDCHGRVVADVQLEVDQALGKHEHISLVYGGGEQGVVGGAHESHVQGALGQKQDLGGPGVGVGTLIPPLAKSMRAMEMPSVLRPAKLLTLAAVTVAELALLVLPALLSREDLKSVATTWARGLHTLPFTVVALVASATQKSCRGSSSAAMVAMGTRATNRSAAKVTHTPAI